MKSFVYIVTAGEYQKIGFASDVNRRINQMRPACPLEIELLKAWPTTKPVQLEQHLHIMFWKYHVRGEWFRIPLQELELVVNHFEPPKRKS